MIVANVAAARASCGDDIPPEQHPLIRSREACMKSTQLAISLARKHGTRLHVLHISTADELRAVRARPGRRQAHHRRNLRAFPAFQRRRLRAPRPSDQMQSGDQDRRRPRRDHARAGRRPPRRARHRPRAAPARRESRQPYPRAPSGLPLVQYALQCALERVFDGQLTLERVVEAVRARAGHAVRRARARLPARGLPRRSGAGRPDASRTSRARAEVLSKCGWSPFEGTTFRSSIAATFVNGHLAWRDGQLDDRVRGARLEFAR